MFKVMKMHLGVIRAGNKRKIAFPYEDIVSIISMVSPCDCAIPINNIGTSEVVVDYTAKNLPIHLQEKGITQMAIEREIVVSYNKPDGTQDVARLKFTATVIK